MRCRKISELLNGKLIFWRIRLLVFVHKSMEMLDMRVGVRWEAVQGCRRVIFGPCGTGLNKIVLVVVFGQFRRRHPLGETTHPRTIFHTRTLVSAMAWNRWRAFGVVSWFCVVCLVLLVQLCGGNTNHLLPGTQASKAYIFILSLRVLHNHNSCSFFTVQKDHSYVTLGQLRVGCTVGLHCRGQLAPLGSLRSFARAL